MLFGLVREDSWKGFELNFGDKVVKVSRGKVKEYFRMSRGFVLKLKLRVLGGFRKLVWVKIICVGK